MTALYLVRAIIELAIARWRHATVPMAVLLAELQTPGNRAGAPAGIDLDRMIWALGAAAARVPWRSDCLVRVLAAHHWLRSYGLPTEFYLGARKAENGALDAHAWLACNGRTITGGEGVNYATLLQPTGPEPAGQ